MIRAASILLALAAPALADSASLQDALARLRGEIRALTLEERRLAGERAERAAQAQAALAAQVRLASAPPMAFLLHPEGARSGLRAFALSRALAPELLERVASARRRLGALAEARAARGEAATALQAAAMQLDAFAAGGDAAADAALRALAAQTILEQALALETSLTGGRAAAPPPPPWSLPAPAARRAAAPGFALDLPAAAPVAAPVNATLRVIAPAPGRGLAAALEPAPGVLLILAGLGRIDAAPGAILAAGAVFAAMPGAADEEFLINTTNRPAGEPTRRLYIDIRRDGAEQDPAAWFAAAKERTGQ